MEIMQRAKNGEITLKEVTWEEMTEQERERTREELPHGERAEEYATFRIYRNKKGEITQIRGYQFTEEKKQEIDEAMNKPNILDAYTVAYKLGDRKTQKNAREKFTAEQLRVLNQLKD